MWKGAGWVRGLEVPWSSQHVYRHKKVTCALGIPWQSRGLETRKLERDLASKGLQGQVRAGNFFPSPPSPSFSILSPCSLSLSSPPAPTHHLLWTRDCTRHCV